MALVTTGASVLTSKGESSFVVVKCRRGPSSRTVTLSTIRREARLGMIGCCGRRVIRHVAGVTVRWRAREPVGMALHAVHRGVLTRERERCGIVVEGGRVPVAFIMTQRAVSGEARRHVVRIRGGRVFR